MRRNTQHGFVVSARLVFDKVGNKSKWRRTDEREEADRFGPATSERDMK
jgi:hypothetical protein